MPRRESWQEYNKPHRSSFPLSVCHCLILQCFLHRHARFTPTCDSRPHWSVSICAPWSCGYCISAGHPSCGKVAAGRLQSAWPGLFVQPSLPINHLHSAGCLRKEETSRLRIGARCSTHVHARGWKHTLADLWRQCQWVERCSATKRLYSSGWIWHFYWPLEGWLCQREPFIRSANKWPS